MTRRSLLHSSVVSAGGILLNSPRSAQAQAPASARAQRVVLVIFGGGVAFQDVFPPINPQTKRFQANHSRSNRNLVKLFTEGTGVRLASPMVGHHAAVESILTGVLPRPRFIGAEPPGQPTLTEYVRRQRSLPAGQAWLCGGGDELLLAHSQHPQYGPAFGPNRLDAPGLFSGGLKQLLDKFARADPPAGGEAAALVRLRQSVAEGTNLLGGPSNDPPTMGRLYKLIADQLADSRPLPTGPGARDVQTLRTAGAVFKAFQPVLTIVLLSDADIGHESNKDYLSVIESNDRELGGLIQAIDADPQTKAGTALIVLPEFGRDTTVNVAGGRDHTAGVAEVAGTWLVARGAGIRPQGQPENAMRTIDVCPTICTLLGARAEFAQGRVVAEILT